MFGRSVSYNARNYFLKLQQQHHIGSTDLILRSSGAYIGKTRGYVAGSSPRPTESSGETRFRPRVPESGQFQNNRENSRTNSRFLGDNGSNNSRFREGYGGGSLRFRDNRSGSSGFGNDRGGFRPRFNSSPRKQSMAQLEKIVWEAEDLTPLTKNFYTERPEVARRTVPEIQAILQENEISIKGAPPIPKPVKTFAEAGFPESIASALSCAKYTQPTAIQKIGFPIALSGRDFVGISKTGSGKTVAFLCPAITHIQAQPKVKPGDGPIALVLAPTRELCVQTMNEATFLGKAAGIRVASVYGGMPKSSQAILLSRGVELVVACPGRLIDFLSTGDTNLKRTSFLILDEADRMMDMGFEPQIRSIVSQIRPDRQTLMYSATWPAEVQALARDFCKEDPVEVRIGSQELHANPDVSQKFCIIPQREKMNKFLNFVTSAVKEPSSKILVFVQTRSNTDLLRDRLISSGIRADTIHGGKSQAAREITVQQFRQGRCPVLVATDVAARGLDINDVTLVINYDLPDSAESYVHRIGRTARAGKKGEALTYFAEEDHSHEKMKLVRGICRLLDLANQPVPSELMSMSNSRR